MPTTLSTYAMEKGTMAVTVVFSDENGSAVTPNTGLNWTLTDVAGSAINGRTGVTATPATAVTIVLSGSDLALTASSNQERVLTFEGTYNGSLGTNLPIKDECRFIVYNLTKVT